MKLEPRTTEAFDSYVKTVEQQLTHRWEGKEHFLASDGSPKDKEQLLRGKLVITPGASPNPIEIPDGLIHDWVGAAFFPHTTLEKVMAVLQDFDAHSRIYPEIVKSRLIARNGGDLKGYWRVARKQQFVPATYDIEQEAQYRQVGEGKWICRDHSTVIREVKDAGSKHESLFPADEGLGLLWRLNAYWSLQATDGGVMAECRTISLSRGIPSGMGWIIKPFIQNVPRESLNSTLANTRKELEK
jgi:hypothetical protein